MSLPIRIWLKICLFNLMLVALIGTTLRYKIIFPLPWIDQKHLLHSHSHFAFTGWISQLLFVLMVHFLKQQNQNISFKKYNLLLALNLISAYGMLLSFFIQGYAAVSIGFSTLSILVSYFFAYCFWLDSSVLKINKIPVLFFKASLIYNILSSAGAFALAFMMANKIVHQNWYLAAQYFFLHFQYNGWFFFACMGLASEKWLRYCIPEKTFRNIFFLLALACVPSYFLSTLWMKLPVWVYIIVILSAFAQILAWIKISIAVFKHKLGLQLTHPGKYLLTLSFIAVTIKLLLQLGSTIPSLSIIAFGFRPIIIGYLHLVLLGIITLFLLGYICSNHFLPINKSVKTGALLFSTGVVLNECLLMIQGITAMGYISLPYIQESLLMVAFIMFTGLILLNFSSLGRNNQTR